MIWKEDNSFQELRKASIEQWIEDIKNHEDILVRGGAIAVLEYINDLEKQIANLESENKLKDTYLQKLKEKK